MGSSESRISPEEILPKFDDYDGDQRQDYDSGWEPGKSYGTPYFEEKGTSAIKRKRSCTDVICLLLFLVFLAGWGFIAFLGR